jgi:arylsulfatase A-like enzyme
MQAPLIIRAPGMPENNRVASLVEFIDIYPTLCELAELPLPEHLQGRSLVPLLKDSGAVWKDAAVGRYGIGETIRTDRYRYSEFLDKQGDLIGRMLYDHREDPRENVNIVDRPEHEKLVKYLAEQLDARKGK